MNAPDQPVETDTQASRHGAIHTFLVTVRLKYGDKLYQICLDVLETTPEMEFNACSVLAQAKLRLQELDLQCLAAMNATSFS